MGRTIDASPQRPTFTGWLLRRLARSAAQCLAASFLLFLLIQALPGDAATASASKNGAAAVEAARARMGLDRPVLERYLEWVAGILRGDPGTTLITSRPVAETITQPVLASLSLAAVVLLGLVLVTLPVAVVTGARPRHPVSRFLAGISVAAAAIPEFVVAIALLAVLAVWTRWLPVLSVPGAGRTVWENPVCLVMPALSLWLVCSASLTRRIQALVTTHAAAPYVREAELAGLQLLAQTIPYLLGGAVVVETVTSFPGLGFALVRAVGDREVPVVMAAGVLMMVVAVVAFTVADALSVRQERMVAVV